MFLVLNVISKELYSYIELHTQLKHAPICEMINIW